MNPVKAIAKSLLSETKYVRLADAVFRVRKPFRRLWYRGRRHHCPCCDSDLRVFLFDGVNLYCPVCAAYARHRLLGLYLKRKGLLDGRLKLLEIAPLRCSRYLFGGRPNIEYLSADLESPRAMVLMDITRIDLPDNQFDAIVCYHVLEHIPEDRKAAAELFRVLRPGGWAIIDVPMAAQPAEKTFEDPSIVSPEDRRKHYGTPQHLRLYGLDFADRQREAGFEVVVDNLASTLTAEEVLKYGVKRQDLIHFCRKAPMSG